MDACNEANYRFFGDWQDLTAEQQATHIAHYLLNRLIKNHAQDAENKYVARQQHKRE